LPFDKSGRTRLGGAADKRQWPIHAQLQCTCH